MLHIKKSLIWILAMLMVFFAVGCNAPAGEESAPPTSAPEETDSPLMDQYPAFFGLDTSNGLDVFVAKFAPDVYSCSLFPSGQVDKDSEELLSPNRVDLATMKEIIALYKLPAEAFTVIPYQNPLSSYIVPDLFQGGAIAQLRYDLGLGEKPEEESVEPEDTNNGPFPYTISWADYSEDGERALRLAYCPFINQDELAYPAVGIKNAQELDSFLTLARSYFSLNASILNKKTFNENIKKYDGAFFQKSGIVIVYIPSGSISIGYKLADAALNGEELHITVVKEQPEGELSEQPAGWFMAVELPQEIISQASYFTAD